MKKFKNKLNLPAIMLIFLGLVIIAFAIAFTIIDPSRTMEQLNNIIKFDYVEFFLLMPITIFAILIYSDSSRWIWC